MKTEWGMLLLLVGIALGGCGNGYKRFTATYTFPAPATQPNYALLDYWAAHPDKKDPSDSVPVPLLRDFRADTTVDVFFIHPTTYTGEKTGSLNASIQDAELSAKTDYTTILYQASIFNETGRVFAPRYRQAHYSAYFPKTGADTFAARAAFALAYRDVKTAFEHYLTYENDGRPFILASHSQGTNHAIGLLRELVDGRPLARKLVAAYLIGMPVAIDTFHSLKPCVEKSSSGCLVSWRTYREGFIPTKIQEESFKAIVTNPLTWDTSTEMISRKQNTGSILLNFNKLVQRAAGAGISGNVLWTEKPHFPGSAFLRTRNYHVADMNLYYLSIRNNARLRVAAYRKKTGAAD